MDVVIGVLALIVLLVIIFEYRLRRPDQIVLFEKNNTIQARTGRFFPRHFSLAIPSSQFATTLEVEAEAKGHLAILIRLALNVAPASDKLNRLIRTGGWKKECVSNATKEIHVLVEAAIKEYAEQFAIEELMPENLAKNIRKKIVDIEEMVGLALISVNVLSVEAKDKDILVALQQAEEARIMEQTEKSRQRARIAVTQAKVEADEAILEKEHQLELKRIALKKETEKEESAIAEQRINDELERKKLQLEFEEKEMALVKEHPELLMLSPQLARLAEASQNMPNAKTVVSLSPEISQKSSQLMDVIMHGIQNVFSNKESK